MNKLRKRKLHFMISILLPQTLNLTYDIIILKSNKITMYAIPVFKKIA